MGISSRHKKKNILSKKKRNKKNKVQSRKNNNKKNTKRIMLKNKKSKGKKTKRVRFRLIGGDGNNNNKKATETMKEAPVESVVEENAPGNAPAVVEEDQTGNGETNTQEEQTGNAPGNGETNTEEAEGNGNLNLTNEQKAALNKTNKDGEEDNKLKQEYLELTTKLNNILPLVETSTIKTSEDVAEEEEEETSRQIYNLQEQTNTLAVKIDKELEEKNKELEEKNKDLEEKNKELEEIKKGNTTGGTKRRKKRASKNNSKKRRKTKGKK